MRSPLLILCAIALGGCGAATTTAEQPPPASPKVLAGLVARARPIGASARFHPALRERPVAGCRPTLGMRAGVHVELFAADRVVLLPGGIGTRPPRTLDHGRITKAGCYGPLVTLEPTGVVLVRPDTTATLAALFDVWGQSLTAKQLLSFPGAVRAYVNGQRVHGDPRAIPLRRHDEIVLEVGPLVAPHRSYRFPPGA